MAKQTPYISWSQLSTWEWSPAKYKKSYIDGIWEDNIYFALGSKLSDALEHRESPTDDPVIDELRKQIPDFPCREYRMTESFEGILLHGRLDGFDPKKLIIREDKTGTVKWTQKRVDTSGQITFYATLVWLKFKKLPKEINLYWAETKLENEKLFLTGKIKHFKTSRELKDIILLRGRIEKAKRGIDALWEASAKIDGVIRHLKRSKQINHINQINQ